MTAGRIQKAERHWLVDLQTDKLYSKCYWGGKVAVASFIDQKKALTQSTQFGLMVSCIISVKHV